MGSWIKTKPISGWGPCHRTTIWWCACSKRQLKQLAQTWQMGCHVIDIWADGMVFWFHNSYFKNVWMKGDLWNGMFIFPLLYDLLCVSDKLILNHSVNPFMLFLSNNFTELKQKICSYKQTDMFVYLLISNYLWH